MIRLGFVLALCVCGSLAYNIGYDLEAMDREWSRGTPGTVGTGGGGNSDCKKDMWILWDNSWSVGRGSFEDKVRPFLKKLINSPQLNVGPEGTHIGILTFSTQAQTKVLLELGELQSPVALNNYLDSLEYDQISGDGTRTGMALKIADEKFTVSSPGNYRPDVTDVVLIFTDGEPIRRRNEDKFGDKYRSSRYGEGLLAKDRAQSLREKDVTVVGLAVGTEVTLSRFRDDIKEWTTEGKYFETNKDSLQSIMNELISASCIDPGECGCSGTITANVFAAQGGKAVINWEVPTLKCASGRQAVIKSTDVQPPGVSPPLEFGVGMHRVTYTYGYLRGTKVVRQQCPVEIDVAACECPGVVRVNAELAGGSSTASVSWTIPKPNCPVTLSSVSPPEARNGNGRYPIGKYDVSYNYEHSSASGSFSLSCPVKITIKGQLCGGVGFGPSQVCCCGTVHERKANYDCCGPKYYDTRIQRCADFYTLVDN